MAEENRNNRRKTCPSATEYTQNIVSKRTCRERRGLKIQSVPRSKHSV